MRIDDQPPTIIINGQTYGLGMQQREPLVRAAIISLFTWRRARPDDDLPGTDRMGWWGDSFATVANDKIGSRLWLLGRAKLTAKTPIQAREYAIEALQWFVDDGVASRIDAQSERQGLTTLALAAQIYKTGGSQPIDIRFTNLWGFLTNV